MKDSLIIYDTTLRDGEQAPGFKMNSDQKLEIAYALKNLGVDIIEAGFPVSSLGDFESVRRIAQKIDGPVISALARCKEEDIKAAGEALQPAIKRGRGKIHVFIATSPIHREIKLRKTPEEVIEMAIAGIKLAKQYTDKVEFSPEDFARTELDYTIKVVKAAIDAGADTINMPDTVGYRFPTEIKKMFEYVIEKIGKDRAIWSIHAHNDLGNATSNALYAILGGARQAELTVNGIGERAGNTALEEVVASITERPDFFPVTTNIKTELITPTSKLVSRITGKYPQLNKAIIGGNAFRHSSGIHTHGVLKDGRTYEWILPEKYGGKGEMPLTARSGRNQLEAILKQKQIPYDPNDIQAITQRFKKLADHLQDIYDDTLVQAVKGDQEIPKYYELIEFTPTLDEQGGFVKIKVRINGKEETYTGRGNGMISATQDAIRKLTKIPIEIEDYHSEALTSGGSAKGQESILVKNNSYRVLGIGIDHDTVRGAAKALLDASNRLRYIVDYLNKQPTP